MEKLSAGSWPLDKSSHLGSRTGPGVSWTRRGRWGRTAAGSAEVIDELATDGFRDSVSSPNSRDSGPKLAGREGSQ